MTGAFSWQKFVSLALLHSLLRGQTFLLLQLSLDFLLLHSTPLWWKGHPFFFFLVLVLGGLIGLHRTVQLQLLQHWWLGHRLGLLWYWMGCLGNEQRLFCHFWDCIWHKIAEYKDICSSSPVRTQKLQLTAEQTSIGECWSPSKKDAPCPRTKQKPQQDGRRGRRGETKFRIKFHAIRDVWRAQTKTCVHQDPGIPQETEPDLPLSVWVSPAEAGLSNGLLWGQGLWLQQTWEVWHVSPTIEPSRQPINWKTIVPKKFSYCCKSSRVNNKFPNLEIQQRNWKPPGNLILKTSGIWLQNFHRSGETLLEGTKKTLCTPGPRRKQQWPYRRLSQTFLWTARSLWQRHGLTLACCGVRGTESNSPGISPFEGGLHYCHYPYHSLASGQTTGRATAPPINRKLD